MNFKGNYKIWYDRLVLANYGIEYSKKLVEKFILLDSDKYWKEILENFLKKGERSNEAFKKVEIIRKSISGFEIYEKKVKIIEYNRKKDLELLEKAIPKNKMKDGIWYDCEKEAKAVARFGGKAKWIESKQMFLAPGQQQFGMDGYLYHWEDAINTGYAGFVPMWEVEKD